MINPLQIPSLHWVFFHRWFFNGMSSGIFRFTFLFNFRSVPFAIFKWCPCCFAVSNYEIKDTENVEKNSVNFIQFVAVWTKLNLLDLLIFSATMLHAVFTASVLECSSLDKSQMALWICIFFSQKVFFFGAETISMSFFLYFHLYLTTMKKIKNEFNISDDSAYLIVMHIFTF